METPGEPLAPSAHTNDGFFKAVFSQPEHAIAFFKSHLPSAITAKTDWSSLKVLPGSFVKSSLQQLHSDLLFSVHIGGCETLLYLLLEHQSSPDPAMPLPVLGYVTEIYTQHHKATDSPCRRSCLSFSIRDRKPGTSPPPSRISSRFPKNSPPTFYHFYRNPTTPCSTSLASIRTPERTTPACASCCS